MDIQTQHCYAKLPSGGGGGGRPAPQHQCPIPHNYRWGQASPCPSRHPCTVGPNSLSPRPPSPAYTGDPQGLLTLGPPPPRLQSVLH